jgi:hypothetical protein
VSAINEQVMQYVTSQKIVLVHCHSMREQVCSTGNNSDLYFGSACSNLCKGDNCHQAGSPPPTGKYL